MDSAHLKWCEAMHKHAKQQDKHADVLHMTYKVDGCEVLIREILKSCRNTIRWARNKCNKCNQSDYDMASVDRYTQDRNQTGMFETKEAAIPKELLTWFVFSLPLPLFSSFH